MERPVKSTIKTLEKVKGNLSYRELAINLGYSENMIGFLNDILKKKAVPSLDRENELRGRLGLKPITEEGYPVRQRKIDRPYANESQTQRKNDLGVDWNTVIMAGLLALEKDKRDTEDPPWDEGDEPAIPRKWIPPIHL